MINITDTGISIDQEAHIYHKGYQACKSGYGFGPFIRDHYLIHFVESGCGIFQTQGRTYHVNTNEAFVIFPDMVTYYQADEHEPWSYYWVGFHGQEIGQIFADGHISVDNPVIKLANQPDMIHLAKQIYELSDTEVIHGLKSKGLLYLLLDAMVTRGSEDYKYFPQHISHKESYVEMAIDYIKKHYTLSCKVEDMARTMGIERSHLSRVFREVMGITLQDYLIRFRMEKAKALLVTGQLSVKAVGCSVGYYDPYYFSKIFKKIVGCTPSEYDGEISQ